MAMTTPKKSWEESYADLVAYHKKYGNCNVPRHDKEFPKLGYWVSMQRQGKSFCSSNQDRPLRQDQINRLDALGFVWVKNRFDKLWNEKFERLERYKQEHGDCLVPQPYEEDPSLGLWVKKQRTEHKHGTIREDRKARLEELGFSWVTDKQCQRTEDRDSSTNDFHWKAMYQALVDFRQEHGHVIVPQSRKRCDYQVLGQWVSTQRTTFLEGLMPEDRKELLDKIGFVWRIDPTDANASLVQAQWDAMYERLAKYEEVHGHCEVPQTYTDAELATWVNTQRVTRPLIDTNRVHRLNLIGFSWKLSRGAAARKSCIGRKHTDEDDDSESNGSDDDAECSSRDEPEVEGFTRRDNGRVSSDAAQREIESTQLIEEAVEASSGDPPKYSVGTKVKKCFEDYGWFTGEVTSYDGEYYHVIYEDGDSEDYDDREMEDIILTPDLADVEVGSRLAVYRLDDDHCYEATVTRVLRERNSKRPLYLHYDDGDCGWIDLCQHKFRILPREMRRSRDGDEVVVETELGADDDSISNARCEQNESGNYNDANDAELAVASEPEILSCPVVGNKRRRIDLAESDECEGARVDTVSESSVLEILSHPVEGNKRRRFDQAEGDACEVARLAIVSESSELETSPRLIEGNKCCDQAESDACEGARFGIVAESESGGSGHQNKAVDSHEEPDIRYERENRSLESENTENMMKNKADIADEDKLPVKSTEVPQGDQVTYEDGRREENSSREISDILLKPDLPKVEIGSRIAVYRPGDDNYYEGTVTCQRDENGLLCLEYDDGDCEWIDLSQHKFRMLPGEIRCRRADPPGRMYYETEDEAELSADDDSRSNALRDHEVNDDDKHAKNANESVLFAARSEVAASLLCPVEGNKHCHIDQAQSYACEVAGLDIVSESDSGGYGHQDKTDDCDEEPDFQFERESKSIDSATTEDMMKNKECITDEDKLPVKSAAVPHGDPPEKWVGPKVKKFFEGYGWLTGEVTSCHREQFQVTYEDGRREENSSRELSEIMLTPDLAKIEIGSRVAVYRFVDDKYYEANVTRERNEKKPFYLEYVNGEHEWIDFRQHKFRLLPRETSRRNVDGAIEAKSGADGDSRSEAPSDQGEDYIEEDFEI